MKYVHGHVHCCLTSRNCWAWWRHYGGTMRLYLGQRWVTVVRQRRRFRGQWDGPEHGSGSD